MDSIGVRPAVDHDVKRISQQLHNLSVDNSSLVENDSSIDGLQATYGGGGRREDRLTNERATGCVHPSMTLPHAGKRCSAMQASLGNATQKNNGFRTKSCF